VGSVQAARLASSSSVPAYGFEVASVPAPSPMKSSSTPSPAAIARWMLGTAALLAGIGLIALGVRAAGSLELILRPATEGGPGAAGAVPLGLGLICLIYGLIGLVFHPPGR
jgi:hypothetical protein